MAARKLKLLLQDQSSEEFSRASCQIREGLNANIMVGPEETVGNLELIMLPDYSVLQMASRLIK